MYMYMSNYLSDSRLQQFKDETEKDETLQALILYINNGWPALRNDVPIEIRPYYNYRQELSVIDGIILKDNRIVVPVKLRNEMKKILHSGHLGIVKTKGRARDTLYWPGTGCFSQMGHILKLINIPREPAQK